MEHSHLEPYKCTLLGCYRLVRAHHGLPGLEPITIKKGNPDTGLDSGTPNVVQLGDLRIEPASVAFGVVALESTATQSIVVSNTGSDELIVRQAGLEGDDTFSVSSTTSFPTQLAGSDEVVVDVSFTPLAAEAYTAGIQLDVNTLDEPFVIELTGAGEGADIDTGDTDTDSGNWRARGFPYIRRLRRRAHQPGRFRRGGDYQYTLRQRADWQIVGNPSEFGYQPAATSPCPR